MFKNKGTNTQNSTTFFVKYKLEQDLMRLNGTNKMKHFTLVYKVGMVMTGLERYEPFKFVGNDIDKSCLPFMSNNQWYFQTRYCYHSISLCPILSHSFSSQMAISLTLTPGS